MFYLNRILGKKGPLALVWMAAHNIRKLKPDEIRNADLEAYIEVIQREYVPISLRTTADLLVGVCVLHLEMVKLAEKDMHSIVLDVQRLVKRGMKRTRAQIDLPNGHDLAAITSITIPEVFNVEQLDMIFQVQPSPLGSPIITPPRNRRRITLAEPLPDLVYGVEGEIPQVNEQNMNQRFVNELAGGEVDFNRNDFSFFLNDLEDGFGAPAPPFEQVGAHEHPGQASPLPPPPSPVQHFGDDFMEPPGAGFDVSRPALTAPPDASTHGFTDRTGPEGQRFQSFNAATGPLNEPLPLVLQPLSPREIDAERAHRVRAATRGRRRARFVIDDRILDQRGDAAVRRPGRARGGRGRFRRTMLIIDANTQLHRNEQRFEVNQHLHPDQILPDAPESPVVLLNNLLSGTGPCRPLPSALADYYNRAAASNLPAPELTVLPPYAGVPGSAFDLEASPLRQPPEDANLENDLFGEPIPPFPEDVGNPQDDVPPPPPFQSSPPPPPINVDQDGAYSPQDNRARGASLYDEAMEVNRQQMQRSFSTTMRELDGRASLANLFNRSLLNMSPIIDQDGTGERRSRRPQTVTRSMATHVFSRLLVRKNKGEVELEQEPSLEQFNPINVVPVMEYEPSGTSSTGGEDDEQQERSPEI